MLAFMFSYIVHCAVLLRPGEITPFRAHLVSSSQTRSTWTATDSSEKIPKRRVCSLASTLFLFCYLILCGGEWRRRATEILTRCAREVGVPARGPNVHYLPRSGSLIRLSYSVHLREKKPNHSNVLKSVMMCTLSVCMLGLFYPVLF